MRIPIISDLGIDNKTGLILLVAGLSAFVISRASAKTPPADAVPAVVNTPKGPMSTKALAEQMGWNMALMQNDPHYGKYSGSVKGSFTRPGGISAFSARAYESTSTTDPNIVNLETRILNMIIQRAENISTVIPNVDTIKAEIKTHDGQLQVAWTQYKAGTINAAQLAQYLQSLVTEIATKLQIALKDSAGSGTSVPDYYQQYYQQYQNYLNQLNSNYYDYYQPPYQYYPGTSYDYYQPYQYQYPNPYMSAGSYPYSYPYYGQSQYYSQQQPYGYIQPSYSYYYPQQQQSQGSMISIGGPGGINIGGSGGLFGGLF